MEIKKGFYAMGKKLDLNKTVYDLVQEYPELVDILKELGFSEITKTAMLHSVGRMTTIPKGAKMKKISMMSVVSALMQNGFELVGTMPDLSAMNTETHEMKLAKSNETAQSNESAGNNETEESKVFELSVVTTENTYSICGQYSKISATDWTRYRPNTVTDNHLITSSQLNTTLQAYYTKSQVDAISATLQNYINSNTQTIARLRADYEERMLSTPKYHKANWLLDEIDQQGRVTAETSIVMPVERFNSMWWAVKQSKMITFYGIPDVYRESQIEGAAPDNANSIIVKFLISEVITTYTIEKKYIGNIQTNENLYLQVTRTDDQIDRVNSIMTKGIDIIDNPTMVGSNVHKYTVDLSDNLNQFSSFSDIGDINNVPLLIDPNLNIASLMGDLKVIECGGLLTDKTDYINLPDILGYPSLTLYGSLVDDNTYISGSINLSINEEDNLVINYVEVSGSTHSLVINNNISNDQIAAFLNSIIKNFSVIKDTKAISLLLSIFQCTVQFGGVVQGANFFIRTNNTYQLHTNNDVPLLEIAEL